MKDGILSQLLTERGYFVLLKQLMKYKRVLKIQNKEITIKIRGVRGKKMLSKFLQDNIFTEEFQLKYENGWKV